MQQALLKAPDRSEQFWALHWYRLRDRHPLANRHLWAHLQDPCYTAAAKVTRRFNMVQCSLSDGFQIAIANADRILDCYNPAYGSNLGAYARIAFGNRIRDHLRQQQEVNISSDWGLLRRVSQTQLTQALQTVGFVQVNGRILIWQCFRAICTPEPGRSSRGLAAPTDDQFAKIAQRFNQQRHQLAVEHQDEPLTSQDISVKRLKSELIQLATVTRSYLTPAVTSLNQPQYDDSGEEQLDALSIEDTPMTELLATEAHREQQQHIRQIGEVLKAAIADLDTPSQTLLRLYYQEKLTQKNIADQLDIQQYQVSRKLSRIRQRLLLDVINWSQEVLHISTDSDVLASVSEVIHEWLQHHYSPEPPKGSE